MKRLREKKNNLISRISGDGYVANIAKIMTGSFLAQSISLISSPILSRIFSPEDYGSITLYVSIISIVSICATFCYSSAVILDKSDEKAYATTRLCMCICGMFGLVLSAGDVVYGLFAQENGIRIAFLILLPVEVTMTGLNNTAENWLKRRRLYGWISRVNIMNAILLAGMQIVFGLLGWRGVGLLAARGIAIVVNASTRWILVYRLTNYASYRTDYTTIISQMKKHKKFPIFSVPLQLMNSTSANLPVLMLNSQYADEEIGSYSKANSITHIPINLISNSVGSVFYQEATNIYQHKNSEEFKTFVIGTFHKLVLVGLLMTTVLVGFGDIIFRFVLGTQWETAGIYSQILAPMYFVSFVESPLSQLIIVREKQQYGTIIGIVLIIGRFLTLGACVILKLQLIQTLQIYSISSSILQLCITYFCLKLAYFDFRESVLYEVKWMLACYIPMLLIRKFILPF